jgi:ethanolamine permease
MPNAERDLRTKEEAQRDSRDDVQDVVAEVLEDSGLEGAFRAEDVEYLRERALKKPLKTIHIWSLAVGVVITGMYFGWNFGLPVGGPLGVLIAALIVSLLYLTWVLTLTELSVSIPFSGGPYAYGRRAGGKFLGFMMGWSFFLECLFATIGTGLATGGYVAFLFNSNSPSLFWTTVFSILTVIVFFLIQVFGAKEQAQIMLWLTYVAIVVLVWFWLATKPGWASSNIVTHPLLPHAWTGVLGAVPFALWFLVIIETVALAPEEAEEPQRTIPIGMTLGQLTLIVLTILTAITTAAAYANFGSTGTGGSSFPLSFVMNKVYPGAHWFVLLFGTVAVSGMIVSYNGMIYATSRQSYSLGRAGYFPQIFGRVHATRRTPAASLAIWSLVSIGFIVWGYWNPTAVATAILISTFTALVWYVLAVLCLFVLRRREPGLPRPYRVPIYPWLPIFVAGLSVFAAYYYSLYHKNILWWMVGFYTSGVLYYFLWARNHVQEHAPEEVTARVARELARRSADSGTLGTVIAAATEPGATSKRDGPRTWRPLEWLAAFWLALAAVAVVWVMLMAQGIGDKLFAVGVSITLLIVVIGGALLAVAAVSLVELRKRTSIRGDATEPVVQTAGEATEATT